MMKSKSIEVTLRSVRQCFRNLLRTSALESEVKLDPITGLPAGVAGRITLRDTPTATKSTGISIDDVLKVANDALAEASVNAWVLLDRLDIAFAESKELEENALRALFKVYLDLRQLQNLELKIFLRDDIWKRITRVGFREASHITKHITIKWDSRSLLNLIVKRAVLNNAVQQNYGVTPDTVLASHASQE